MNYWIKRITPKNKICKSENRKKITRDDNNRKMLSLYDLGGPFIFLFIGSMLSLFVFLVEKIYYYFKFKTNMSVPPSLEVRNNGPSLANIDPNIGIIVQLSVDDDKQ